MEKSKNNKKEWLAKNIWWLTPIIIISLGFSVFFSINIATNGNGTINSLNFLNKQANTQKNYESECSDSVTINPSCMLSEGQSWYGAMGYNTTWAWDLIIIQSLTILSVILSLASVYFLKMLKRCGLIMFKLSIFSVLLAMIMSVVTINSYNLLSLIPCTIFGFSVVSISMFILIQVKSFFISKKAK